MVVCGVTNTDICNIALSYIGKRQIQSLDEQSETARQCKLHYNNARQNLLRSYAWGFAKKVTVAALLNTKYPGWEYVYAYPSECVSLRLIKLQQMYFQYAQMSLYEAKISSANEQHDETNWPHKYSKARL